MILTLLTAFVVFALLLKGYFKLAERFGIFDVPNSRSSHTHTPVRGAGIIFIPAIVAGFILTGMAIPIWFICGLMLLAVVSFWDDVKPLPASVRFPVHLVAAGLMVIQLWGLMPWLPLSVLIILLTVVFINGFNFMDGINGITGFYSIAVILSMALTYYLVWPFSSPEIFIVSISGLLAFGFYNFRKKALCFAGDVGSVTLAYFISFMLATLVLTSGEWYYILFVSVYTIDFGITILHRILLKEKIWEPHRKHLYQLMVNEHAHPHLLIAGIYGLVQFIVNAGLIILIYKSHPMLSPGIYTLVTLIILSIVYLTLRYRYYQKLLLK
ncbi:MraY family glycosyltransferase [Alkaliflexus imshenetskii]|uniref:hypothetical protein n=1 Tax=Alkaliflexus imshenetskii TaxID=286730 RepID=UPI00047D0151|nr:hypothetical protein [Alkaliflexus imshenetskii]